MTNAQPSDDVSTKFKKIVDRFHLILSLHFVLPNTDKETLEKMSIPSYEPPAPKIDSENKENDVPNGDIANGSDDTGDAVDGVVTKANDNDVVDEAKNANDTYFKATFAEEPSTDESNGPTRILKVLVHKNQIIGNLKRALEPYIEVPMEYFKIFRHTSALETECSRLNDKITMFE